jgi:hypothetical protein
MQRVREVPDEKLDADLLWVKPVAGEKNSTR